MAGYVDTVGDLLVDVDADDELDVLKRVEVENSDENVLL